jgi:hypothetical protein
MIVFTKKTSGALSTDLYVHQLDTYSYLYLLSPWDSYGFSSATYYRSGVSCQGFLTSGQYMSIFSIRMILHTALSEHVYHGLRSLASRRTYVQILYIFPRGLTGELCPREFIAKPVFIGRL